MQIPQISLGKYTDKNFNKIDSLSKDKLISKIDSLLNRKELDEYDIRCIENAALKIIGIENWDRDCHSAPTVG